MRKSLKITAIAALFALCLGLAYSAAGDRFLPDRVYVTEGERFSFSGGLLTAEPDKPALAEASSNTNGSYNATLRLFGTIPLRSVRVTSTERLWLVPGGMTFGVKMFTEGVIVVGLADVRAAGGAVCPAKEAGLTLGDVILTIDGVAVKGNDDLSAVVEASRGRALSVEYSRAGVVKTVKLTPAASKKDGGYKAGMWVRDSSAGVGTVTYINESSGVVAGLGHGVTDADTGVVMPLSSGELVPVTITGVTKGMSGAAGELKGAFSREGAIATLEYNCASGVFGHALENDFYSAAPLPVAYKQSIKPGAARIMCTVDAAGPAYYDVEIESLNLSDAQPSRNLVLRVTDEDLIAKTGGIVQGMSGSPIIQNGCIVGALTHVFLNDPTKGYGIFIENMLESEGYIRSGKKVNRAA